MIGYISGKILVKEPTHVVVDVGGIGYEVKISLNTFSKLKNAESAQLQTYLHVKEDALTLYGFLSAADKQAFMDLISINGVGPSTALMVLSSMVAEEFQQAVVSEDVKLIQSVKGIGGKTAQRIVLELKDKFQKSGISGRPETAQISHNTIRNEALSALMTLGIGKAAAEKSVDSVLKQSQGELTLEEIIKLALKTA